MNAISFSLYGSDPKYCIGAIKNVRLAKIIYPGWKCVFWMDKTVPDEIISSLADNGSIIKDASNLTFCGYFWRFLVNDMPGVERFIIRDTDSRLSKREQVAVEEWICGGKMFHVMRDHPKHKTQVMGGAWGMRTSLIPSMEKMIMDWPGGKQGYNSDQNFLRDIIWPKVKNDAVQHDSCNREFFPGSKPFPEELSYSNLRFVGEVFDEHDNPREYDWDYLINYVNREVG